MLSALNATHPFSPQSDNDAQKQLQILRRRYDELEAVKLRAEERYRADYRKFHKLCAYMKSRDIRDKEDDLQADYPKLTKAERRTRRAEIAALIEKKIDELDAGKRQDASEFSFLLLVVVNEHLWKITRKLLYPGSTRKTSKHLYLIRTTLPSHY